MSKNELLVSKKTIDKINRKVSREFELESGTHAYGRIHTPKIAYNRKKEKKLCLEDWY